eukprot:2236275-Rhodomonas_salina.1
MNSRTARAGSDVSEWMDKASRETRVKKLLGEMPDRLRTQMEGRDIPFLIEETQLDDKGEPLPLSSATMSALPVWDANILLRSTPLLFDHPIILTSSTSCSWRTSRATLPTAEAGRSIGVVLLGAVAQAQTQEKAQGRTGIPVVTAQSAIAQTRSV